MGDLLLPPKIYLDTAHLINIYRVRYGGQVPDRVAHAYQLLSECLIRHHFGIIFNLGAPFDWVDGNATEESGFQIASVIDSAPMQYFFEGDNFYYTRELLHEAKRIDPLIRIPDIPILQPMCRNGQIETALGLLANEVPGYVEVAHLPPGVHDAKKIPRRIDVESARRHTNDAFKFRHNNPKTYQERVDGFNDALRHDIAGADRLAKHRKRSEVEWMKRFLKLDLILTVFNPGNDVEAVLAALEIQRCPSVRLWFQAREKRMCAKHPPKDNDVDDWFFLPIVPLVDMVLTDSNFREFLVQADGRLRATVFSDPNAAIEAIRKWL